MTDVKATCIHEVSYFVEGERRRNSLQAAEIVSRTMASTPNLGWMDLTLFRQYKLHHPFGDTLLESTRYGICLR